MAEPRVLAGVGRRMNRTILAGQVAVLPRRAVGATGALADAHAGDRQPLVAVVARRVRRPGGVARAGRPVADVSGARGSKAGRAGDDGRGWEPRSWLGAVAERLGVAEVAALVPWPASVGHPADVPSRPASSDRRVAADPPGASSPSRRPAVPTTASHPRRDTVPAQWDAVSRRHSPVAARRDTVSFAPGRRGMTADPPPSGPPAGE